MNIYIPFVSKTNIVYKGVLFEDSFENYLNKESVSICQFLHFLCIEDISKHVECTYYTNKYWHFKYNVSSLIKLFIVKCFRKLSYDKTISSLTKEEAIMLSFYDINGQIKLPSGGTLHHFIKYRLGEKGINDIMMFLGEKISKLSSEKDAKIDSTPLEASRYDKYADYNTHYGCKVWRFCHQKTSKKQKYQTHQTNTKKNNKGNHQIEVLSGHFYRKKTT